MRTWRAGLSAAVIFLGSVSALIAAPVISAATHIVRVEIDGTDVTSLGINPSLLKMGALKTRDEVKPIAPESCPQGKRLVCVGTTLVAGDDSGYLASWYKDVVAGKTDRKSMSVIFLDRESKEEVRRYNYFDCFPTRLKAPEACDDGDSFAFSGELVEMGLDVSAVEIVSHASKHGDAETPEFDFTMKLDGCLTGGDCPGSNKDDVSSISFLQGLETALPGPQPQKSPSTLLVSVADYNNDDALCAWILDLQGSFTDPPQMRAGVSTSRSNIRVHHDKIDKDKKPGLTANFDLGVSQISSVQLPSIDFSGDSKDDAHIVEVIEFVVEKIERQ
jgi:hypothetical protein